MLVHLFGKIVSMSLIGCYIIGVVFLVRLLLHKCERKYAYFLWLVVFVNLCLPISINAPVSLIPEKVVSVAEDVSVGEEIYGAKQGENVQEPGNTFVAWGQGTDKDTTQSKDEEYFAYLESLGLNPEDFQVRTEDAGQDGQESNTADSVTLWGMEAAESRLEHSGVQGTEKDAMNEQPAVHVTLSEISLEEILGLVWVIGVIIIGGFGVVQLLRLNIKIKGMGVCCDTQEGIVCMEGVESPFLWGIWKPLIYLPQNIEEAEREYIIAHESYHKKRGDHIVKLIVFAIVVIHWFNPLVWAAYVFFIRDMEISCDEAVLSHAQKNINKQYANSLLKYAAKQNGFVLTPLTFGEPSLKSRIHNVLKYKRRGVAVTVIAMCVVALTACGLVLRPQPEAGVVSDKEREGTEQSGSDNTTDDVPEKPQAGGDGQSQNGEDGQNGESQNSAGTSQGEKTEADAKQEYTEQEINLAKQFQIVLGIEDENFVGTVLQNRDAGLQRIYGADSEGHYYAYHANIKEEDDFQCNIRWMKLADSIILQEWSICLQEELEGATKNVSLNGVFYEEAQERIYIVITSIESAAMSSIGMPDTWVLTFPIDNPDDHRLYAYDDAEGAWFGEPLKLGNCLYLHGGSGYVPYEINVETMEGRRCDRELAAAEDIAASFMQEYKEQNGVELAVHWFYAVARYEEITLFTATIAEAMDFPTVATVYLAMQDGEIVASQIVEAQEGESNYGLLPAEDDENGAEEKGAQPLEDEACVLKAVDHEGYNVVFVNHGYQYRFMLDMDTDNLELRYGEDIERSSTTGKWTVTPVYAVSGAQEVLLGELRGYTFDIISDDYVQLEYKAGERVYGIIGEVTGESITIQPVEVIDRDTYLEYQMDVVEESVTYKMAADVEYNMLDANFRGVNTTFERFKEHINRSADEVCCFVVENGVILQIWEPYIP